MYPELRPLDKDELELVERLSFGSIELAVHLMAAALIGKNLDIIQEYNDDKKM